MIIAPPTNEAIDAMVLALQVQGIGLVDKIHPKAEVPQGHLRLALGSALAAGAEHLVQAEVTVAVRQCRICGCTDDEACTGGCSWSQPEICSTCAARQAVADEQYLATMRAQQLAAEKQVEQAQLALVALAENRALMAEQTEVARMQREHLAGTTWRKAVEIAGIRSIGGLFNAAQAEETRQRIIDEAQWLAHHLGNPPVEF